MDKIPCIKCTLKLWEYIKPYLKKWNYHTFYVSEWNWLRYPILILNNAGYLGTCNNWNDAALSVHNRELVTNVEQFLERAAKLKGFTYKRKDMKEFTRADLKPGMVVEYRNGARRLVVSINGFLHLYSTDTYVTHIVNAYNDNLTYIFNNNKQDIVKVYEIVKLSSLSCMLTSIDCLKLIWERNEPVEYTMQEIADKLGIPVEQLRIKK